LGSLLADIGRGAGSDESSPTPVARARACVRRSPSDPSADVVVDLEMAGLTSADLLVVTSHEALDCAVRGAIEGAPCTSDDLEDATWAFSWSTWGPSSSRLRGHHDDVYVSNWDSIGGDGLVHDVVPLFVLRLRDGATSGPGAFEPITGWMMPRPADATVADEWVGCQYTPVIPALDARVRRDPRSEHGVSGRAIGLVRGRSFRLSCATRE
jgi:hypothetical protein